MDDVDPRHPRHYVNYVSSQAGGLDFTLDFGVQVPDQETPEMILGVTMAWEEARIVHRVLTDALANYRRVVGEIRDLEGSGPLSGPSQNGGIHGGEDGDADDSEAGGPEA